jgi:hypothetical protein
MVKGRVWLRLDGGGCGRDVLWERRHEGVRTDLGKLSSQHVVIGWLNNNLQAGDVLL